MEDLLKSAEKSDVVKGKNNLCYYLLFQKTSYDFSFKVLSFVQNVNYVNNDPDVMYAEDKYFEYKKILIIAYQYIFFTLHISKGYPKGQISTGQINCILSK